jgi:regulator of sigma E protease
MSTAERASTLMFKPVGQRALVAAAGPFANFVLAITMLTGLMMYNGTTVILPMISHVTKGGPAEAAGIKAGDRIIRIGSTEITDFRQVAAIVSASKGIALEIGLNRGGHDMAVTAAPRQMQVRGDDGKVVSGVMLGLSRDPKAEMHVSYSPLGAVGAACSQAWETVKNTFLMIGQILTGGGGAEQLSGPVGIAHVTQQVAEFGFLPLLQLVAFLSVSIGLANLFPIPLLDGGHLLYYGCEAVLGRPLGERAQDVGFRLGLVLVLGLVLLTTWNDLVRLNLF